MSSGPSATGPRPSRRPDPAPALVRHPGGRRRRPRDAGPHVRAPNSASALQALLRCPYLDLLGWLLGLDEPAAAPALRGIDPLSYGFLFYAVAEAVFRAHGPAFCAGEGSLDRSPGMETVGKILAHIEPEPAH